MLLLFSFITSCVSSKPVAFFHIICFPKKWLLFSRHMFHQNCLLFSRPQQQLSHNESHYTLWLRFQFPSSISISISISVFKVDLNLDLDFSFASASISVSISVFSFDLSFDFSFSGRSQFQLPASTLLEVDFESGFWDLCIVPFTTWPFFGIIFCGKTNDFTTPLQNTKTYKEREDISCLVVGV